jgi:hypothetical protein
MLMMLYDERGHVGELPDGGESSVANGEGVCSRLHGRHSQDIGVQNDRVSGLLGECAISPSPREADTHGQDC